MTAQYRVRFDELEVKQYFARSRSRTRLAIARGINDGLRRVQTAANRGVRTRRKLKAGRVKEALRIERASVRRLIGSVSVRSEPIPLRDYGAKLTGGRGRPRKGERKARPNVTVQVIPGRRKTVRGGFIVDRLGGHVFRRRGASRLPIEKLFGASIDTAFLHRDVVKTMDDTADRVVPQRVEHHLRRALRP